MKKSSSLYVSVLNVKEQRSYKIWVQYADSSNTSEQYKRCKRAARLHVGIATQKDVRIKILRTIRSILSSSGRKFCQ